LRKELVAAFLLLALFSSHSIGEVIDGIYAINPLIRSITIRLDSDGIDVRNGPASKIMILLRPQLTELRNFPADAAVAGDQDPFTPSFTAGVLNDRAYLVAVESPGVPLPENDASFKEIWNKAPQHKRVFLSFTGKDIAFAISVSNALREKGYITFMYKNGEKDMPAVNAVETGVYFGQAGQRLVLDTDAARQSPAVHAEALAEKRSGQPIVPSPLDNGPKANSSINSQPGPLAGPGNGSLPTPPAGPSSLLSGLGALLATSKNDKQPPAAPSFEDKAPGPATRAAGLPCCKICTYRMPGHILVSCGPITCDRIICGNARPDSFQDFGLSRKSYEFGGSLRHTPLIQLH
jgi:hypothetical protein